MAFVPNTLSNLPVTSGRVFFVSSNGNRDNDGRASDGNEGRDPNVPMATIDAAMARCTANRGDMIVVMPGHAETITASDLAMDVAGVWVYGLGWGASRPTLSFSATGSTIAMSAASCRISNLILTPAIASVVAAVTVSASNCVVEGCETTPHATLEFVSLISVTADSNDVVIRDNVLRALSTGAGSTSGILLDGCDRITIKDNHIDGFFGEHVIDNTTGSLDEILDGLIANNYLKQVGSGTDLVIEMDANATGLIISNMMSGTQALDSNVTPGNMRCVDNYLADADDTHGVVVPTTAAA